MSLYDLFNEWNVVPYEKKIKALKAVITHLEQKHQKDETLVADMLGPCLDLEQDDYFGTDGLRF